MATNDVTIFDTTTGAVNRVFTGDDMMNPYLAGAGEDYIIGNYPDDQYYIVSPTGTKTPTARPALSTVATWNTTSITANGSSTATLGSGLPTGTVVRFLDVPPELTRPNDVTVTGGVFDLTTTVRGTFQVVVTAFPYLETTTTITAS